MDFRSKLPMWLEMFLAKSIHLVLLENHIEISLEIGAKRFLPRMKCLISLHQSTMALMWYPHWNSCGLELQAHSTGSKYSLVPLPWPMNMFSLMANTLHSQIILTIQRGESCYFRILSNPCAPNTDHQIGHHFSTDYFLCCCIIRILGQCKIESAYKGGHQKSSLL